MNRVVEEGQKPERGRTPPVRQLANDRRCCETIKECPESSRQEPELAEPSWNRARTCDWKQPDQDDNEERTGDADLLPDGAPCHRVPL